MNRQEMGRDKLGFPIYVGQEVSIWPEGFKEEAYALGVVCNRKARAKGQLLIYVLHAAGIWAKDVGPGKKRIWSVPSNLITIPTDSKRLTPCTESEIRSLRTLGMDFSQ